MILPSNTVLVAGPVIIENGKILLVRELKPAGVSPFMIPGGEWEESDKTLEDTCRREAKEEVGIKIAIIRPLRTLILPKDDRTRMVILAHYLARKIGDIIPNTNIVEWSWYDITNLPPDSAANVREIVKDVGSI